MPLLLTLRGEMGEHCIALAALPLLLLLLLATCPLMDEPLVSASKTPTFGSGSGDTPAPVRMAIVVVVVVVVVIADATDAALEGEGVCSFVREVARECCCA